MALIRMKRTNKITGEVVLIPAGWNETQAKETLNWNRQEHGDEFTFELIGERVGKSVAEEQTAVAMGAQKEMGSMEHDGNMYSGYCPECGNPFVDYCESCDG